jgi:RsiW-degrading membrane proteinase PrsW (M82 family)
MTDLTIAPDVLAAQRSALTISAWGRHARLFQPRNLASWTFLALLAFGIIASFNYFRPGFEAVSTAAGLGVAVFGLYGVIFAWMLRHLDHWTRLPAKIIAAGALWGGFVATFYFAFPGNGALLSLYNKAVSATFAQDWGAGLAAPFTEETGKGIGILLLIFIAPRVIRTPFDGFMLGAFVGLGFQVTENVSYVINEALNAFGANEVGSAMKIILLRGATGVASHALFSAVYGTGLVYLVGTSAMRPHRGRGVALMITAMVLHGVWDAAAAIAGQTGVPLLLFLIGMPIIELVILYTLFQRVSSGEGAWMHDLMGPELAQGTITEAELTALSSNHRGRRRFIKHASGYKNRRARKHVLEAANDLAQAIARSGGQETAETAMARSELRRVRAGATA